MARPVALAQPERETPGLGQVSARQCDSDRDRQLGGLLDESDPGDRRPAYRVPDVDRVEECRHRQRKRLSHQDA
jgi:hypothetical protein